MANIQQPGADHHPAHDRDDLTGEYRWGDAGQLILAVLFLVVWLADTFMFRYTTGLSRYIPVAVKIPLAMALFGVSGYLARTGMSIVFGKNDRLPGVIRQGLFGVIRHPIYVSEILFYLGFLVISPSVLAAAVWSVAIAFLYFISKYEEKLLVARFGDEYRRYMQEVPMWIPRPWKR